MANTTLKTRIKLLTKSFTEWEAIKSSFYPYKGEICIVQIPQQSGAEICMMKIGQWDGVEGSDTQKSYAELPYLYANASDVYEWAKKEALDFQDLDATFLAALDERIADKSENSEYQMVEENGVWKLQKKEIGATTWTDVSTVDVAGYVNPLIEAEKARALAAEATKVEKEITSAAGKALIFNEEDGGGAKFENVDGTASFAGVNSDTNGGIGAQLYDIEVATKKGAKLDVTKNGIYYTSGDLSALPAAQRDVADNELVTKKDIKDLEGGMHYIGKTELAEGETYAQAIDRLLVEKSHTAKAGDIVIIEANDAAREYIYDGAAWQEVGDEGYYASKAALAEEVTNRQTADAALAADVTTEIAAREAADTALSEEISAVAGDLDEEIARAKEVEETLDERITNLETQKEPELIEQTLGTKVRQCLYANGVSIRIEDNATENIAYYCTADGIQKSITFPYGALVHGGSYGEKAKDLKNYASSLVIMNGGNVRAIYGGGRGYAAVAVATVIVNNGKLIEGVIGGGAAPNAGEMNTVGLASITCNGGESLTIYGGGMGLSTVGKVNMLINGGTHKWVTAGGSNGTTGSASIEVNGGTITCLQTVNRGIIQDATVTINGGNITDLYAGGETSDSGVTGKCEKTILHINSAFNGNLNKGTYGGVEDASRCSGDYVPNTITSAAAAACNLILKAYAGLKQIAYTASTDDLIAGEETWILNCNI